jgi:hypothetical protein
MRWGRLGMRRSVLSHSFAHTARGPSVAACALAVFNRPTLTLAVVAKLRAGTRLTVGGWVSNPTPGTLERRPIELRLVPLSGWGWSLPARHDDATRGAHKFFSQPV